MAPGQLIEPEGLAIDSHGNLWVADLGNARVQELSPDGSVLAVWDNPNDVLNPMDVAVNAQGEVYVVDGEPDGYKSVTGFSPSGQKMTRWSFGSADYAFDVALALDKQGNVYLSDEGDGSIARFSPTGKLHSHFWSGSGQAPLGVAVSPQGKVYASVCPASSPFSTTSVDASGCQVDEMSPTRKTLRVWHSGAKTPPPGTKVDIGGYGLYLQCEGEGSPTVILEAELGDNSRQWTYLQPLLAHQTRVCAYDQAGLGLSDERPSTVPVTGLTTAQELHALLQAAHVQGPYVLVGHSMGGVYNRIFALTYRPEVAGMVLIDSSHEDQCTALGGSACGGDLRTVFQQLRVLTGGHEKGVLGNLPLAVLSENVTRPSCFDCWGAVNGPLWMRLQNDLASASSNNVHVVALKSGHHIPWEQPTLVIEAVHEVVDSARAASAVPACGSAFEQLGGQCRSS